MNRKIILIVGVASLCSLLLGCSNTALEKSVADLNNKVDMLSSEVRSIKGEHGKLSAGINQAKSAAMDASMGAKRANSRIDSIADSYMK